MYRIVLSLAVILVCTSIIMTTQVLGQAKGVKFEKPLRDISIIVTKEGYYPNKISVFEGEKVRFFVTSTMDDPGCFLLPHKEIFLSAKKGVITEAKAVMKDPGSYMFHCPTGKIKGSLVVLPNPNKKQKRAIASEVMEEGPKEYYWMPREE